MRAFHWPRLPPRACVSLAAVLLVAADAALILAGFALAYWMRYNVSWPAPFNRIVQEVLTVNYVSFASFLPYALLLTCVLLTLFAMKSLYRMPRNAGLLDYAGTLSVAPPPALPW